MFRALNILLLLLLGEANICGSAARLQAACHVAQSLINEKLADPLRNTTLAKDALNDEGNLYVLECSRIMKLNFLV